MNKLAFFGVKTVNYIFGIFIGWLFLLSLFFTCYMNSDEHSYVTLHNPLLYLGIICIFVVFIGVIGYYLVGVDNGKEYIGLEKFIKYVMLLFLLFECVYFVLISKATPVSDQLAVLSAAKSLVEGDFSPFQKGGYIYMYSIQSGLVVVYSMLLRIFSFESVITIFQIASAIGVTITYKLLYEVGERIGLSVLGRLMILLFGIVFIPYNVYSMFVYGTVLGFACALVAIKWEIEFLESNQAMDGILSVLFLFLSLIFKSNYLIFFVGMVIVVFVISMMDGKIVKRVIYLVILFVCYWGATVGPRKIITNISGCDLDSPMASIAWIEMGLQDGPRAEGWYNAYNANTYEACDYDGERQSILVKEDLVTSLKNMFSHKKDAVRFFTKKTASQWLNPTFESFWSIQQTGNADKRSAVISKLLQPPIINKMTSIFSYLEVFVLFGTVLFVFLCHDNKILRGDHGVCDDEVTKFIYEIVFIGGFIFYMFCEAKGQYTVVYFVMLIPLALLGYDSLRKYFSEVISFKNDDRIGNRKKTSKGTIIHYCSMACLMLLVTGTSLVCMYTIDENGKRFFDNDNVEYAKYKAFFDEKTEIDYSGEGMISPFISDSVVISCSGENIIFLDISDDSVKNIIYKPTEGAYRICIDCNERYLNAYRNGDGGYNAEAALINDLDGEYWRIEDSGDGQSVFIYNSIGLGLAYDLDGKYVYVSERDGDDNQKWIIR